VSRRKPPVRELRPVNNSAPLSNVVELVYETCDLGTGDILRSHGKPLRGLPPAGGPDSRRQDAPDQADPIGCDGRGCPPRPSYRPHLPPRLLADGILSDAQLESVIYAGEAHAGHLAGRYTVDETYDTLSAAPVDAANAVRFRGGWFLGDGTGAGKGRQVAGIILDNWLKGGRRALWISKSDKLIEDAERDWTAVGGYRSDIVPLARFRQGAPILLEEGILFTTYATLRTQARVRRRAACSRSSTGSAAIPERIPTHALRL